MNESGDIIRLIDEYERFGIVYLDYCSKLTCGGNNTVEKNPLSDIETLFKYSSLSIESEYTILAVCYCVSEDINSVNYKDTIDLTKFVAIHAQKYGYLSELRKNDEYKYMNMECKFFNIKYVGF